MKFTTRVGLALLLVAGASVVVGAGSFTATEADRPMDLSIVGDENAYMNLDYDNTSSSVRNLDMHPFPPFMLESEEGLTEIDSIWELGAIWEGSQLYSVHEMDLVTLENRFTSSTSEVKVEISEVESTDQIFVDEELAVPPEDELAPGSSTTAKMRVKCPVSIWHSTNATVNFDVTVAGEGFSAETTQSRRIVVNCDSIKKQLGEFLFSGGSTDRHGQNETSYSSKSLGNESEIGAT